MYASATSLGPPPLEDWLIFDMVMFEGYTFQNQTKPALAIGDPVRQWKPLFLADETGTWDLKLQSSAIGTPTLQQYQKLWGQYPQWDVQTKSVVNPAVNFTYFVGPPRIFTNDSLANKVICLVYATPFPLTSTGAAAGIPYDGVLMGFGTKASLQRDGSGSTVCFKVASNRYPLPNVPVKGSGFLILCMSFGTNTVGWSTGTDPVARQHTVDGLSGIALVNFSFLESFPASVYELRIYNWMFSAQELEDECNFLVGKWQ